MGKKKKKKKKKKKIKKKKKRKKNVYMCIKLYETANHGGSVGSPASGENTPAGSYNVQDGRLRTNAQWSRLELVGGVSHQPGHR
jgi:hypothetical protein